MKDVVYLQQYKMNKQYQQAGLLSINLALDNVKQQNSNRNIAKEIQLGYMLLLSNYNKN